MLDCSPERTPVTETFRSGSRQAAATRNEAALTAKAVEVLPNFTITPLRAGPTIFASCLLKLVSEFALTQACRGMTSGTAAAYAG